MTWSVACIAVKLPRQVVRKRRAFFTVAFANFFRIPNNDLMTKLHAFIERIMLVKDTDGNLVATPKPWDFWRKLKGLRKNHAEVEFIKLVAPAVDRISLEFEAGGVCEPITFVELLDLYVGSKRAIYQSAIDSLVDKPFNAAKDGAVEFFTKAEYLKPGGVPRGISPRNPRYHVLLALYVKAIEHRMYGAIDRMWDPTGEFKTVAKEMDMRQRATMIRKMWRHFGLARAIGFDAKRFDQHINVWLLKHLEHAIYLRVCNPTCRDHAYGLELLLKLQQINTIHVRDGPCCFTFQTEGVRMSGDMNTSLGNVTVMCCMMWLFREHLGEKFLLLNDGDDCVLIADKHTIKRIKKELPEFFLLFGVQMEYEGTYYEMEQIEFCQAKPVEYAPGEYIMVPNPAKRVFSDLVTEKDVMSRKIYRSWLGAVGACGCSLSPGVPILQEFYSWILRTPGVRPWIPKEGSYYYKYGYRKVIDGAVYMPVSDTARASFEKAYGITPEQQIVLENMFRTMEPLSYRLYPGQEPQHAIPLEVRFFLNTHFKQYDWIDNKIVDDWEPGARWFRVPKLPSSLEVVLQCRDLKLNRIEDEPMEVAKHIEYMQSTIMQEGYHEIKFRQRRAQKRGRYSAKHARLRAATTQRRNEGRARP
jgi:acyl-CoA-binding protein